MSTVRLVSTTARWAALEYLVTDTPKKLKNAIEKTTPIAQARMVAGSTSCFAARMESSIVWNSCPHIFSEGQGMKENRIRNIIVVEKPMSPSHPTNFMGCT